MSGAIMNKIWGAFGMDANEEEEEEYEDNTEEIEEESNKENKIWGRRNKVVAMPQPQQIKMVISQPTTFDQAEDICDLLKDKQSVIVI